MRLLRFHLSFGASCVILLFVMFGQIDQCQIKPLSTKNQQQSYNKLQKGYQPTSMYRKGNPEEENTIFHIQLYSQSFHSLFFYLLQFVETVLSAGLMVSTKLILHMFTLAIISKNSLSLFSLMSLYPHLIFQQVLEMILLLL